jgi:hypothetical protein
VSKRFGRPTGPSMEDSEREAEREVARLQQQAGARPPGPGSGAPGPFEGGPGSGLRTPLDDIAESARGKSLRRGQSPSPLDPGYGPMASGPVGSSGSGTGPFPGGAPFGAGGPFVGGGPAARGASGPGRPPSIEVPEFEDPEEESASITELALRDLAGRYGTNPEDMVIRTDPAMAEAMRDEAMRRFMDRQQARHTEATVTKLDPSQTVLGRLAARRKAREEGREPDAEPEPTGRGLLGRLGQLPEQEEDEGDLTPLERRARELARRREQMQEQTSGQVFDMPTAGPRERGSPELAAMAARLTGRAKPRSAPRTAEPAPSPAPPAPASARKAAVKKAAVKKAAAKKAGAKKVTAKTAAAKKVGAKKATVKKATVKKATVKKAAKKVGARAATKRR